ncbi:general secretion pathway protein GspD [Pseudomonas agarici]|uniref:General secretion pathway protein GspD n=1 Tax=Pseudomonas agarici TaxID=46677 RepID=A0A0X8F4X6_PSEAA|nr:secretin and TonB N-terminal domain-containing protein [Pseudomonas agarici]AMB83841.1 general secretion pathway protein GspD [Pseudomonas agarici]NWB93365.1 general secretion pathway protein GspD [Pseudomonas agarici]NWC10040.1 general secretion pathway protein GspD [Pseudomonas agarici]SEL53142.1 general secretion pathway protein D [Pseudomonas agarici]
MSKSIRPWLALLLIGLSACQSRGPLNESELLRQDGDITRSVDVLRAAVREHPDDIQLRAALFGRTEQLVDQYSRQSSDALARNDDAGAIAAMRQILKYDPGNLGASQAIRTIENLARLRPELARAKALSASNPREALAIVRQIIVQQPNYRDALDLRDSLTRTLVSVDSLKPKLSDSMKKPVSLHFSSQSLTTIFETIARLSGINFVIDKDVNPNAAASISASRTTAEDALNLLLSTHQLQMKVLNADTVLIYPARPDKEREYRELAVRTFYLSHADPKLAAAEIKQLLKPKEVLVDERLSAVIVRDGVETLSAVEKLVQAIDLADSEVTIDIQVMEVSLVDELNLGVNYPGSIGLSLPGTLPATTGLGGRQLEIGSLEAKINLLQRSGNTVTLANPRIRVKNREKAEIKIGDKIPVVTSTTANLTTTASVSYQDVGLSIEVQPNISLNDEINLQMVIDMTHITKRNEGTDNIPPTFELGSRSTRTTLTARNNETQVVAGLIRTADIDEGSGLPGLSRLPGLGQAIFGTNKSEQGKSEIILLITPRIERNLDLPASQVSTFSSGTEARSSTEGMVLHNSQNLNMKTSGGASNGAIPPPLAVPRANENWQPLPAPVEQPVMESPLPKPVEQPASSAPATPPP